MPGSLSVFCISSYGGKSNGLSNFLTGFFLTFKFRMKQVSKFGFFWVSVRMS